MSKEVVEVKKKQIQIMGNEFSQVLPKHVDPKKFTRVLQTVVLNDPKLLKIDARLLFKPAIKAAELGLFPDGKEAAIVPFHSKGELDVNFIPMYEGLLKLVRNSGELKNLTTNLVYENDKFQYKIDDEGEHLIHEPDVFGDDRGSLVGVYCIAVTLDGGKYMEFMSSKQIQAIKDVSKAKFGPWTGPFKDEMIKKSVFKRLFKRLPKSTDLDLAIRNDEEIQFEKEEVASEVQEITPEVKTEAPNFKEKIKAKKKSKKAKPRDVNKPKEEEAQVIPPPTEEEPGETMMQVEDSDIPI